MCSLKLEGISEKIYDNYVIERKKNQESLFILFIKAKNGRAIWFENT